jgi:hypothetical protein
MAIGAIDLDGAVDGFQEGVFGGVDLAIEECDADGFGEDVGGDFGFEVGEEVGDRGGVGEGLVDVGEEVRVEGGEAGLDVGPGGLDVGVSGLDDVGEEVGDFGLLGWGHLVVAESGVLVEGAAMVEVEEDLGPFAIVALVGAIDGDADVDFAVGGADLGDLGVDAEVAEPLGDEAHEPGAGGWGLGEELDLAADEGPDEAFEHGVRFWWMRLLLYGIWIWGRFGGDLTWIWVEMRKIFVY